MKNFDIGNGHTITVEPAQRGIPDDFKVSFYEDGRLLFSEFGNLDYICYQYDVQF